MLQLLVVQSCCCSSWGSYRHWYGSCIAAVGLSCITTPSRSNSGGRSSCALLLEHLLLQLLLHQCQHMPL
jgi:hypothetical protein